MDNTFENHHPIGIDYIEGHDRGTNTLVVYGRRKYLSSVWGKISQKQSEGLFAQNRRYLSVCCYQTLFHVFLLTNCCYIYYGITSQANDKGNTPSWHHIFPLPVKFTSHIFPKFAKFSKIWVYYINTGPSKIMFSNMALSYNKLWSSKPYLRAIFETRFVFLPKHSSSYIFKYSQQNFCQSN